jgi:hypothetical protein
LALLAATALALAACGTEEPDAGTPAPAAEAPQEAPAQDKPAQGADDPCALLTQEQAAKALGMAVKPGEAEDGPAGPQCVFGSTKALPINNVGVGISTQATSADALKSFLESGKSSGFPYEAVDGVGDAAYYVAAANTLHVVAGGRVYHAVALTEDAPGVTRRAAEYLVENVT